MDLAHLLLTAALMSTPHCVPEEPAVLVEPLNDGTPRVRSVEGEEQPGTGLYYMARVHPDEQVTLVPKTMSGEVRVVLPADRNSPAAIEIGKNYTVTGPALENAGGKLGLVYVLELYRDGKCCGRREVELQLRLVR